MRGLVPGLQPAHPLGPALPALYQTDPLAQELVAAFDEVLAPAVSSLDNLSAYLDPMLAPADFLDWLSGWVGMALDENWELDRRRALVSRAVALYGRRGTGAGLAEQVRIYTGGEVVITESGAVAHSETGGSTLPGTPDFSCKLRVTVADPKAVNVQRLNALVAANKPAHVGHTIELVAAD